MLPREFICRYQVLQCAFRPQHPQHNNKYRVQRSGLCVATSFLYTCLYIQNTPPGSNKNPVVQLVFRSNTFWLAYNIQHSYCVLLYFIFFIETVIVCDYNPEAKVSVRGKSLYMLQLNSYATLISVFVNDDYFLLIIQIKYKSSKQNELSCQK